jgi:hypothetical protein
VYPESQTTHWERLHPLSAFVPEEIRQLNLVQPLHPALVDRIGAGSIDDAVELRQWRGLGAAVKETRDRVALAIAQLEGNTLAVASGHQCHEVRIESPFTMSHVWLAEPSSYKDCLEFWLRRSISSNYLEREYWVLTTPDVFIDPKFQAALKSALASRPHESDPSFLLASVTLPKKRLQKLAVEAGLELHTKDRIGISFTNRIPGLPPPPLTTLTVAIGIGPTSGRIWYGLRTSPTVDLFAEGTRIRIASPFRANPQLGTGPVRIRLSEAAHLQAPAVEAVAQLFHDQASWRWSELEIPQRHAEILDIPLRIPAPRAILDAVIREKRLKLALSRPGRYAQAVLSRLTSPGLFMNPNVEKVVSAITSSPTAKLLAELGKRYSLSNEAVGAILGRLDARPPRLERSALEIRRTTGLQLAEVLATLDELAFAGLLERGLTTECDECGLRSFQGFGEISPRAICPACGSRAHFAGDAKGPQLHYRLNALLDRASANGALVHLYAVAALVKENAGALVLPGADVTRANGTSAELDLLGLVGRVVFGGEAKRSAAAFTNEQLERDVALTREVGGTRHVMVCLDEIPRKAVENARKIAAANRVDLVTLSPPSNTLSLHDRAS